MFMNSVSKNLETFLKHTTKNSTSEHNERKLEAEKPEIVHENSGL
jgi:hypothetical protein